MWFKISGCFPCSVLTSFIEYLDFILSYFIQQILYFSDGEIFFSMLILFIFSQYSITIFFLQKWNVANIWTNFKAQNQGNKAKSKWKVQPIDTYFEFQRQMMRIDQGQFYCCFCIFVFTFLFIILWFQGLMYCKHSTSS